MELELPPHLGWYIVAWTVGAILFVVALTWLLWILFKDHLDG